MPELGLDIARRSARAGRSLSRSPVGGSVGEQPPKRGRHRDHHADGRAIRGGVALCGHADSRYHGSTSAFLVRAG